ncbi:ZIP zinc transporter-domain-containing protein [Pilobolus umbonatus]|nr:ZIP zinc transporter-domain-containing protein [Pilobolus umbonatus]
MKLSSYKSFLLLFIALTLLINIAYGQSEDHDHDHEEHDHEIETPIATTTGITAPTPTATAIVSENDHDHDHDHDHEHEQESELAGQEDHDHDEHEGHDHGDSEAASGHIGFSDCSGGAIKNYNLGLRIGSVFILLACSAIGVYLPIVLHHISPYEKGSTRDWILTIGKFFGTGVIISTAFIHVLPEGLAAFQSPCIGSVWLSYNGFGGMFCLLASFGLQIIELAAISNLEKQARLKELANKEQQLEANGNGTIKSGKGEDEFEVVHSDHNHGMVHVHSAGFLEADDPALRNIGTLVLELGILIHSVIIGITLGTTEESYFTPLFIAIVFHQVFEGIALGTRINELQCTSWGKPLLLGAFFMLTTPFGVAVGIGIRSNMQPGSAILAQAILNSLSSGVLLYSAYVSLMSMEINHNHEFRNFSMNRKIICFFFMYLGAAIMAFLGAWA